MAEPQLCLSMTDIIITNPVVALNADDGQEDVIFAGAFAQAPKRKARAAKPALIPFKQKPMGLVEADQEAMELEDFDFRAAS